MKVFKKSCKNCLFSKDAIVSPERRKQILEECRREQRHFICHKAQMNDEDICCKKFYDQFGHESQMIRIAERLGILEFVDSPDTKKLSSYNERKEA